jgi:hypothetical protein
MNLFFRSKKFPDALDTAVYTTVHVVSENSLITLISHELDGDWQFMGAEPIEDYTKIAKIVALGQIIKKDKSVLKVADLPRGHQATRLNKNDDWVITKIEYSEQEIEEMGFLCSSCGEYHNNIPFAYGSDAPYKCSEIPEGDFKKRCELTNDICIIDESDFYIKGNLLIPVENNEDFSWNVWVQIPSSDFKKIEEQWEDENRFLCEPYVGKLANRLEVYPDTLNLQVKVHIQKVGYRPKIEVLESKHPLFYEQENGITTERVTSFAMQILYGHSNGS